jgi:sugar lactone lactonase YvrE
MSKRGYLSEYDRIRGDVRIAGFRFDSSDNLYVGLVQGAIYCIHPNKSGRIINQFGSSVSDVEVGDNGELVLSKPSGADSGVVRMKPDGQLASFVDSKNGAKGLLLERSSALHCLMPHSGELVTVDPNNKEVSRVFVCEPKCFAGLSAFDGSIAKDSSGAIYITAGRSGSIFRVDPTGKSEPFISGLLNPTGITLDNADNIYVLESGAPRILRISRIVDAPVAGS